LEEGQRRYALDNSGLVKLDFNFDPHRPYQRSSLIEHELHDFIEGSWETCPLTLRELYAVLGGIGGALGYLWLWIAFLFLKRFA
jgi:hypothetical protein